MPDQIATRRKYNSARRRDQARHTRRQIGEAARKLFYERGYEGATMDAIAAEAGVARETVYAVFKNKQNILAYLLDISVGGDEQPIKVIDRPGVQATLRDTDQRRQLVSFAHGVTEIQSRAAPVFEVTRIAAKTEPQIDQRIKRLYRERLGNMRVVARAVASNGSLREGMDEAQAAEILWGLSSPELFLLMTEYGGWSAKKFGHWLGETLQRLLLP
jgi:AcrR family transcriptional regulator